MGRLHLLEIEDQSWCPRIIRESITDYLLGLYNLLHIYDPAYQKIVEIINRNNVSAIVDCCSGSGGPIPQLRQYLDENNKKSITITLTDKFPNQDVFKTLENKYDKRVLGYKDSIDACQLPPSLKGLRSFFSAFHHFAPDQAVKILQDAVDNNAPIAIFEITQRNLVDFIRVFMSPLLMWVIMPFAKKLNWKKFFLTYIIPITPFAFMWDYFVSNLRTYSPEELRGLISRLDAPGYTWDIGKLWSKKAKSHVSYLVGYKQNEEKYV